MRKLSGLQKRSLQQAASHYASQIGAAADYLESRGITTEVANTYQLGVVAQPMPADEDYRGRLSIPYLTVNGVVDIRYRALGPEQGPKYLSRPNATTRLFNVSALLSPANSIVVCEGEIDTIVMHSVVGVPAVGVPGASNWKPHYRLLLEDFEHVIVMCDGDTAGREFGKQLSHELDNAYAVHLPDGMDVNDCLLAYGPEYLRERVAA